MSNENDKYKSLWYISKEMSDDFNKQRIIFLNLISLCHKSSNTSSNDLYIERILGLLEIDPQTGNNIESVDNLI